MKYARVILRSNPCSWYIISNVSQGSWSYNNKTVYVIEGSEITESSDEKLVSVPTHEMKLIFDSTHYTWKIYKSSEECIADNFVRLL